MLSCRRERQRGEIAPLLVGVVTVLLLQPAIAATIGLPAALTGLAFPFQLCIGTAVAFLVCAMPAGRGAPASQPGNGTS